MKKILTTLLIICTVIFVAQGKGIPKSPSVQNTTYESKDEHEEVTSVKDGLWSDKSTWSNGKVPKKQTCVTIYNDVHIDVNATICCLKIMGKAKLTFDDKNVLLQLSSSIVVAGTLQATPVTGKNIIEFTGIDESKIQGATDGMSMPDSSVDPEMLDNGLWVVGNGRLNLQGKSKTPWTNITDDVKIGATSITVNSCTGWEVGDEIVVAPTDNADLAAVNYNDNTGELIDPYVDHFERRIITQVSGNTVYFKDPLKYIHSTVRSTINSSVYGNSVRVWTAEVANLSRNMIIRGTKDKYNGKGYEWQTYHRAHIMINSMMPQRIVQIEGTLLGPRKMQEGRRPEFIMGRYALHFHMCGDGSVGSIVKGNSFHDLGSHVFVPHLSNGISLRNNVTFNSLEAPFWYDDDSPTHDLTWNNNLMMASRWSGINSSMGMYLGQGDNETATNNVAVYCQTGDGHAAGAYTWNANNESPLGWVFKHNLAHSCGTGIWTWQNTGNQHFIEDFDTYNTVEPIVAGAYGNRYIYTRGHHYGGRMFIKASSTALYNVYMDAKGGDYAAKVVPSPAGQDVTLPTKFVECVFQNYRTAPVELGNEATASTFNLNDPANTYKYLDLVLCDFPKGQGFDFNNNDYSTLPNSTRGRVQPVTGQPYQRFKQNGVETVSNVQPFAPYYWGSGDGLVCSYFTNSNLQGQPLFSRVEREIRLQYAWYSAGNFPNGIDHRLDNAHYSERRTGSIEAQCTAAYTFRLNTGMGCRLWIDGKLVIDRWGEGSNTTSKPIQLVKGQKYDFKLETYVNGAVAICELFWNCAGMEYEQTVPFSQFYQQSISTGRIAQTPQPGIASTNMQTTTALEQNTPNPCSNTTKIGFTLPNNNSSAKIVITTASGVVVKDITVVSKSYGNVTVDVSNLPAGTYRYTLYADGKRVDSKQMLVIK